MTMTVKYMLHNILNFWRQTYEKNETFCILTFISVINNDNIFFMWFLWFCMVVLCMLDEVLLCRAPEGT